MTGKIIEIDDFEAPGFTADKINKKKSAKRGHKARSKTIIVIIGIVTLILLGTASYIVSELSDRPITYEREYKRGYTTGDDSSDNIITVDPQQRGERAYFKLRYYILNNTLVINEENIRNITLYYDRAIKEAGNSDFTYYNTLISDPIYVKVYPAKYEDLEKNFTIMNLPKTPKKIYRNGEPIPFTMKGNDLFIKNVTTSSFTITFSESYNDEGGGSVDIETVSWDPGLGFTCCSIMIIIGIIAFVVWLFKK